MKSLIIPAILGLSLLTACGGGGSSGSSIVPPVPTATPKAPGCYGTNPDGSSVFLSPFTCASALAANPTLVKFNPLNTVGNPGAGVP